MEKPSLLLLGAGGHARACIDVVEREGRFTVGGILASDAPASPDDIYGYPYLGRDDELPRWREKFTHAFIAIGMIRSAAIRIRLFTQLKELGFILPVVVSPLAYVSPHATVGEGTVVMHRATVNASATVGANCILNTGCLIEHDAVIGDHCHVSTMAAVNGTVRLGAGCFVGSNATIVHQATLPDHRFVGAGTRVLSAEDSKPMEL